MSLFVECLRKDLGPRMHRVQHVFAGERVQAFSDAVFAIVATIMVNYEVAIRAVTSTISTFMI